MILYAQKGRNVTNATIKSSNYTVWKSTKLNFVPIIQTIAQTASTTYSVPLPIERMKSECNSFTITNQTLTFLFFTIKLYGMC